MRLDYEKLSNIPCCLPRPAFNLLELLRLHDHHVFNSCLSYRRRKFFKIIFEREGERIDIVGES